MPKESYSEGSISIRTVTRTVTVELHSTEMPHCNFKYLIT